MRRGVCSNLVGFFVVLALTACASKTSPLPAAQPPVQAEPAVQSVESSPLKPQTHLETLVAQCTSGDANSCYVASHILSHPNASDDDNKLRANLELRACELGHGGGCNNYGVALANGLGVDRDNEAAAVYFGKSCELGDLHGCTQFAGRLREGRGIEKDVERARKLLELACEEKQPSGCNLLGDMLVDSGTTEERAEGIALLEQACALGQPLACFRARGLGSTVDFPAGLAERTLSAEKEQCAKGYGLGCHEVGTFYFLGLGVPVDVVKAMEFYQRGCDMQFADSCKRLADIKAAATRRANIAIATKRCDDKRQKVDANSCFESGRAYLHGGDVDAAPAEAVLRLRRACDAKHADGCQELGYAAYHGLGVKPSRDRSIKFIAKACRLGRGESCNESGMFLVAGNGKDLKNALRFFERGCTLNDGKSCANVFIAEIKLNRENVDRARLNRFATRGCELGNNDSCVFKQRLEEKEDQANKAGEPTAKTPAAAAPRPDAKEHAEKWNCVNSCFAVKDSELSVRELREKCEISCGAQVREGRGRR